MITGDNERTAEAIGVTAGIVRENDDILTGKQLEEYSDEQLMQVLPKTAIFARTSPFHKHRIVSLYQKLGHVVAVTGDGVNDAIALKQADVGVAMGLVGTDVARETADMVITDDNFASIVVAIEEGRGIITNIKKSIQYLLPCNVSEVLALIVGLLAGVNHIFFPIQLLYVNLVTHGPPALVFAFAPRSSRTMKEPPHRGIELLEKREKTYILVMGVIAAIGMLAMYYLYAIYSTKPLAQAAVFSGLTFIQQFVLFDLWFGNRNMATHVKHMFHPIFLAAFLFPYVTQLLILRIPTIADMFSVPAVSMGHYWAFVGLSLISFFAMRGVRRFIHI
jgi:Ca2+-transporting ATPase